ncbi:MAG: hypothetical protein BJ554DRAFT_5612, partial [Olpidium bornovanus]
RGVCLTGSTSSLLLLSVSIILRVSRRDIRAGDHRRRRLEGGGTGDLPAIAAFDPTSAISDCPMLARESARMASTIRQRITPSYLYDGISSASQNLDSSLSQSADESLASLSPSESLTDDAHVGPDSGGRGNDNVQQAESGRGEETEDCEEDPVADDEEQAYNGDEPTPRAAAAAAASSGDGLPDDIRLESDGERPEGDDVDVEGSDEQLDAEKEEQLYGEADGLEADRQAGGCRSPRDGWGTEADDADGASKLPRSSASRSTTPGSIRSQEAGTLRAGSPSDFFPKSAAAAARRIRRRNSCRDSSSPLGYSSLPRPPARFWPKSPAPSPAEFVPRLTATVPRAPQTTFPQVPVESHFASNF